MENTFALAIALGISLAGLAGPAQAQTFPPPEDWTPFFCSSTQMFDPIADVAAALNERDLVGDFARPAGLRAVDDQFLYLRMRLDTDPAPGGVLRPFAWGFAFDLDSTPQTYEAAIILDGATGLIAVHRNTATSILNSPADPANDPPVATGMYSASRGRTVTAPEAAFGGSSDTFLDLAIPWSDLAAVNITRSTILRAWAASSNGPGRLDGDLACHSGTGGAAELSGADPAYAALDPAVTSNVPDGGIPAGQTRGFEGGPGCALGGSGGDALWVLALFMGRLRPRRKRQQI